MVSDVALMNWKDAMKALDIGNPGYWYFLVRSKEDTRFFTTLRDFHFGSGSGHERDYEVFLTSGFQMVRIRKSKENKEAIVEVLQNDGLSLAGHGTNYDAALGYGSENKRG